MRVLVLSLLLLSGCSSIYHPQEGWVPEGYSEQQQGDHQYTVRFQSYRGEDWLELKKLLLYRAAQLASSHEHSHFLMSNLTNQEQYEIGEAQAVMSAPHNSESTHQQVTAPYMAFHNKIRTVDALITYIDTPSENSYDVQQLLASTTLD